MVAVSKTMPTAHVSNLPSWVRLTALLPEPAGCRSTSPPEATQGADGAVPAPAPTTSRAPTAGGTIMQECADATTADTRSCLMVIWRCWRVAQMGLTCAWLADSSIQGVGVEQSDDKQGLLAQHKSDADGDETKALALALQNHATPRLIRALKLSTFVADGADHTHLGVEHVFLGILASGQNVVTEYLSKALEINVQQLADAVNEILRSESYNRGLRPTSPMTETEDGSGEGIAS